MSKFKPGHQILFEAVKAVLAQEGPSNDSVFHMYKQIDARIKESLPSHLEKTLPEQIVRACAHASPFWPHAATDYLLYRVGRAELLRLLSTLPAERKWKFIPCDYCPKYRVISEHSLELFTDHGIEVKLVCEYAPDEVDGFMPLYKYGKPN